MVKPLTFAAALLFFVGFCRPSPVQAQATNAEVEIRLDTSRAAEGRKQLKRLLREYDLEPWLFTRKVLIKPYARSHSHPVLRLNTKFVDDDEKALSTFLHEQAHWHEEAHKEAVNDAIDQLREHYPDPPNHEEIGTRSEYSTYLHLIVNWQELDGMAQYVGEEKAREVLSSLDRYEWIYGQVLQDTSEIGAILAEHGLLIAPGEGLVVGTDEQ
jgi:hypothetical protein